MKSKARDHNDAISSSAKQTKERKSVKRILDPTKKMSKRSKSKERGRKSEKSSGRRSERKSRSRSRDKDFETIGKKQRRSSSKSKASPSSKKERRGRRPSRDRDLIPFDEAFEKSKLQDLEFKQAELKLKGSSSEVSLLDMAEEFQRDLTLIDLEQPSVGDSSSKHLKQISIYEQNDAKVERGASDKGTKNGSTIDIINYRMRCFLKNLLHFRTLKAFQCICAIYICIMTFKGGLMDPDTGYVVDKDSSERTEAGLVLVNGTERPIVAESDLEVLLILVARLSAWFMYPSKSSTRFRRFLLMLTQPFLTCLSVHLFPSSSLFRIHLQTQSHPKLPRKVADCYSHVQGLS